MRFNPKARLDTSRVRQSGRGGGSRAGGMPIPAGVGVGGGIGGIVLVVIFIVATQFLGGGGADGAALDTSRMDDSDRYAECETGEDANNSADCARVAVENSLFDYWSEALPDQGDRQFRAAESITTFSGSVATSCGNASSDVGPFYCPADETIYLDTTFFEAVLERQLGGPGGDFVEPYVLAHEYGHHIQNLLGAMGRVKTQQGPTSDAVRLELQADCYAGMWTAAATRTEDDGGQELFAELDQADITEALDAAAAVGDDRIQQKTGGQVTEESWTHGSARSRMRWFQTGFDEGTLAACDTWATNDL
ncbi:neutral zinc metallopeptidase [Nocardioides ferulae]|uniref:KPN_02809 family neutral zinc metallopeptidase n=1 Tax=Nocardioides ferulae TaxID=2340821 RepID=UPI000EB005B1|nr:neutral zinc metallopeptidase [Nocardioides ferulae]